MRISICRFARHNILTFCFLLHAGSAFSLPDIWKNKQVSAMYHYGYIWAHRPRVEHLTTGHTQGAELTFLRQTTGTQWWQRVHGYPQTGLSLVYFDLANPEVVGSATGLIGFIQFPIFRNPRFQFSLQAGAGPGYLSKRFDALTDHKNMGIGSHGNVTIRFMFQGRFQLTKTLFAQLNYGITHFSNAAYHLPNLGINNISLSGGLGWQLSLPEKYLTPEIPEVDRRWVGELVYGMGVKENFPPDGKQFFAHTFYGQLLKPLSHKVQLGFGADVFYDLSLFRFVENATSDGDKHLKTLRGGIHGAYEMKVNRFALLVHMGIYFLDQTKIDSRFYHRYGLKYDLGKRLFINLSLKTHWARADYAELGLGWRFRI